MKKDKANETAADKTPRQVIEDYERSQGYDLYYIGQWKEHTVYAVKHPDDEGLITGEPFFVIEKDGDISTVTNPLRDEIIAYFALREMRAETEIPDVLT